MDSGITADVEASSGLDCAGLRSVFSRLPHTAVLVLRADAPRFTIVDVTDAYLAATLKQREQLVGQPLFDALPENNPSNPAPTGISNLRASLEKVIKGGAAHQMPVQRYDVESVDGSWEERFWAPHNVPLLSPAGNVQAVIHHVRDVTAEVLSQRAARRAEQTAAQTLQRMADAHALLDGGLRFVTLNAAAERLLGMLRSDLLGRTVWEAFPASRDMEVGHAFRRALAQGVEQHLSQHYVGDGFDLHLEIDAYPTEEGGLAVFWRDVTQRVRAEAELRQANQRKDVFIATLAHELRNPLAPIRTGMQILRMAPPGSPMADKALGVMERQLAHTVRLLDDLLDVSRISRGKLSLRMERIGLRSLIEQACEAGLPFIEAGRHQLVTELEPEDVDLEVDCTRLLQVIGNLLNNAAKYTPPGGTIRLSSRAEGGEAVIEVSDTGVGIPADKLGAIFELFTQLEPGGYSQNGLGIGLSLSRTLVEMHGGTLQASSTGPGQGSRFTIRLPLR